MKNSQSYDHHQHFALRKLNIGLASVLVGIGLTWGIGTELVHADATPGNTEAAPTLVTTDKTTETTNLTTQEQQATAYQAQPIQWDVANGQIVSPDVNDLFTSSELKDLNVTDPSNADFSWSDQSANQLSQAVPGKAYPNMSGTLYKNTDDQEGRLVNFPSVSLVVKALPVYTVVGEVPNLSINTVLSADVQQKLNIYPDEDIIVTWQKGQQPDVTYAGESNGIATVTYPTLMMIHRKLPLMCRLRSSSVLVLKREITRFGTPLTTLTKIPVR